jgi:hypothetical protein
LFEASKGKHFEAQRLVEKTVEKFAASAPNTKLSVSARNAAPAQMQCVSHFFSVLYEKHSAQLKLQQGCFAHPQIASRIV